jgi:hypothetical protein
MTGSILWMLDKVMGYESTEKDRVKAYISKPSPCNGLSDVSPTHDEETGHILDTSGDVCLT